MAAPSRALLALVLVIVAALPALAGRAFALRQTRLNPAAVGVVEVRGEKNGTYELELTVRHLAPPGRLAQSLTAYVVWIEGQNGVMPVGTLKLDDDLEAKLRFTTTLREFAVVVSAEPNSLLTSPGKYVVLSGRIGL